MPSSRENHADSAVPVEDVLVLVDVVAGVAIVLLVRAAVRTVLMRSAAYRKLPE